MQTEPRVHPLKLLLQSHWPRISQSQLARRLNIADATVHRYLTFKQKAPDSFYAGAAALLGVTEAEIRPTSEPTVAA
jgi:transcriptional regulator with XRE-family HTH domain